MKCLMQAKRRNILLQTTESVWYRPIKPLYQLYGVGSFQNTRNGPDPSKALGQVGMQYAPCSTGCDVTL